jgi:tetratricopeptide (TPR) repeat protein
MTCDEVIPMLFLLMTAALTWTGAPALTWSETPALIWSETPALTWTDIVARLDHGAAASDAAELRAAIADAHTLAEASTKDRERALALSGAAYGAWRLCVLPDVQTSESVALMKRAEQDLRALLKINPRSGEAYAMLANVLGQMIRLSGGANKMELGPEASANRAEAMRVEPDNPRVVLLGAVTLFHTPPEYGGGPDKAEADLRRAIALFAQEPPNRPWPNWGRFDAHAWLGQTLAARGDKAGARAEYNLALAEWPQSRWVRSVLLPALDK